MRSAARLSARHDLHHREDPYGREDAAGAAEGARHRGRVAYRPVRRPAPARGRHERGGHGVGREGPGRGGGAGRPVSAAAARAPVAGEHADPRPAAGEQGAMDLAGGASRCVRAYHEQIQKADVTAFAREKR